MHAQIASVARHPLHPHGEGTYLISFSAILNAMIRKKLVRTKASLELLDRQRAQHLIQ